jgi:hypothetical protein
MSDASLMRSKGYSHNIVHEFDGRNLVRGFLLAGSKPTLLPRNLRTTIRSPSFRVFTGIISSYL